MLIAMAAFAPYPKSKNQSGEASDLTGTLAMIGDPFAMGPSVAIFLYVAVEAAIYVWMPTLLKGYSGTGVWLATYSLAIFFVLRAAGRIFGSWVLSRWDWAQVLMVFSLAICVCFLISMMGGAAAAVYLLPLSGLFMSVLYPTINSKGISCFRKNQHGAVSGVILFFTCASATLGPLAMGAVSDWLGHPKYGFYLATVFPVLLFLGLLLNWMFQPARARLAGLDEREYGAA